MTFPDAGSAARDKAAVSNLIDVGRFTEARRQAGLLVAATPDDVEALCLLSVANFAGGDPQAALEVARRVASLDPTSEWAFRLQGNALLALGRKAEAVTAAEHAVRLAPNMWSCWTVLAYCASNLDRKSARAETAGRRAVELAPHQSEAHSALGYVLMSKNRREARTHLQEALRLDPNSKEALNNLAVLDLRTGKLQRGMRAFAAVAAMDPSLEEARRNLRATLLQLLWWLTFASTVTVAVLGGIVTEASPAGPSAAGAWAAMLVVALSLLTWRLYRQPVGVRRFCAFLLRRDPSVIVWSVALLAVHSWVLITLLRQGYVTFSLLPLSLVSFMTTVRYARDRQRARRRASEPESQHG